MPNVLLSLALLTLVGLEVAVREGFRWPGVERAVLHGFMTLAIYYLIAGAVGWPAWIAVRKLRRGGAPPDYRWFLLAAWLGWFALAVGYAARA